MTLTSLYYGAGLMAVVCASNVIISNSAVFSLIFLVLSFLFASVLLLLLEANFLGLLLIVIYVGAIAVLFLFTVMVVETKLSYVKADSRASLAPVGIGFGVLLFILIVKPLQTVDVNVYGHLMPLVCTDALLEVLDVYNFGGVLYSYFAFPILIVGLILLVVILGVSRLTGGRSEKSKNQAAFKQLSRTTRIY